MVVDELTSLFENERLRPAPRHYVYADVALVSGVPRFVDERVDTLLNAQAIVEVCSPGSWTHDHVRKGGLYRKMPDCVEYWLIHCEEVKAEHWRRTGVNEWRAQFIEDPKAVFTLECLGLGFRWPWHIALPDSSIRLRTPTDCENHHNLSLCLNRPHLAH